MYRQAISWGINCIIVGLIVGFPPYAFSQDLKIAYVNYARVIEEAPQAKAEFKPRDQRLLDMQTKIKSIQDSLEKDALIMKSTTRRSLEKDLIDLKRNLRRATQEFREDYNIRRNEELAALQKTVDKAIVDIAKRNKYDLVIHEGTIYASKNIDPPEIEWRP